MRGALYLGLVVAFAWPLADSCPCFAQKGDGAAAQMEVSTQLMVVTTPDWNAVDGRLQRYERTAPGQAWKAVGDAVPVVVGKKGMGWGLGIVPVDRLRGANEPVKQEGDGKSPAGVFSLGTAFGFAEKAPGEWKMPYLALTPSIDCVDDAQSSRYNTIADRSTVTPDWNSAEHMRAVGEAYRWGVVVDQNAAPAKKNGGSCVFMHVWSGAGHGTAGCTAMPREQIETILGWLDPVKRPLLVQMPMGEYSRLRRTLRLPGSLAADSR
jgi:L,D-peptidoglycan transpeptidase YkuD (ErfK/YbiS/YcfS/YnhG family)